MVKLRDLSLEELYTKEKISPTAEALIREKEDFTNVKPIYCDKVCKYCHKNSGTASVVHGEQEQVDLVILQDHHAVRDKYKDSVRLEKTYEQVFNFLVTKYFKGGKWKLLTSLKCRPVDVDEKIKDQDIKRCSPYVLSELTRLKPKAILCLGSSSSKILGCNKSIYTNRGEIHNSPYGPVVHSLHPKSLVMLRQNASGQMWGPDYFSCLDLDFQKAVKIASGNFTPVFDLKGAIQYYKDNHITICRTLEEAQAVVAHIESLPPKQVVSFDTETTGLDPFAEDAKLLCIQFGWMEENVLKAAVIPLWHRENTTVDPDKAWELTARLLLSNRFKVAHNGKFDIKYIFCTKGIRVTNVVLDTQLLLHELNSGIQGNYSLKKAVWDYMYETGLGGYEDLLPELTTGSNIDDDDSTTDEVSEETST